MPALSTAKELRAERRRLAERMREIMEDPAGEDGRLSSEQEEEFDRLHERQSELGDEIEEIESSEEKQRRRREQLAEIEKNLKDSAGTSRAARMDTADIDEGAEERDERPSGEEAYHRAFDAYLRYGMESLTSEARDRLMSRHQAVDIGAAHNLPEEVRAQSVGQDIKGGFFVPEGFFNQVISATKQFGGMRRARTTVLQTNSGGDLPIPTDDDTSNEGEIISENTTIGEQDVEIGQAVLHAYMYTSKIVKVSRQLLQDSAFDIQAWLTMKLGERIGRVTNRHFTTADGAAKPFGVTVQAASGKTADSATAFTVDELLDLKHAVDPSYREAAEWMFNDTVLRDLKKKKDGDGRPLWQSGIAVGEPNTIDGDPYVVNQSMPGLSASNTPIAYGDFSRYYIRDVLGIQVLRLDERYADALQVGFLAFSRHDGVLVDAGQNPVQVLTLSS